MGQLGVAGNAMYSGIPNPTLTVTGRSGNPRVYEIFSQVRKTPMADVAKTVGNDGEQIRSRDTNDRIQLVFSAKPKGADAAAALVIAADLPKINTPCTIVCANDSQLATPVGGSSVVDACEETFTPEGEVAVDFTVTNWIGKAFVALN